MTRVSAYNNKGSKETRDDNLSSLEHVSGVGCQIKGTCMRDLIAFTVLEKLLVLTRGFGCCSEGRATDLWRISLYAFLNCSDDS